MVQAIRSFAAKAFAWTRVRAKQESVDKLGAYAVDYSEPAQEEVDAANASCAEQFSTGNWVSVNRKL
jgi:hypothetical protein